MIENKNDSCRYEVVERYCPKCGENVIMRKTYGKNPGLKCLNFDNCRESKDSFCGDCVTS